LKLILIRIWAVGTLAAFEFEVWLVVHFDDAQQAADRVIP
jgi:hypothetical protein